jgi:hypothetical protein
LINDLRVLSVLEPLKGWNPHPQDLDFKMTFSAAPGAADLKFLHRLRRVRIRNFKSMSGTRNESLPVSSLVSEVRSGGAANG